MKVREVRVSDADQKSAKILFDTLKSFYDLSKSTALDMFARTGDLTVKNYVDDVYELDLWELGSEHLPALLRFGARDVYIGCSYKRLEDTKRTYDLIIVDTPQGCHHDYQNNIHTEHFGVLERIGKLVNQKAIVVLYCNRDPYNKDEVGSQGYDEYAEYNFEAWSEARMDFFQTDSNKMTTAEMLSGYEKRLAQFGLEVVNTVVVPCYSDVPGKEPYAFRAAFEVVKK